MLKFDEKKLVDRINGALKLRPQVEEVVDRLWDSGLRNICFMGIGGTYASALDAVTAMLESTEQEVYSVNAAEYNTTGHHRLGKGTLVVISSVTGSTAEMIDAVNRLHEAGAYVLGFIDNAEAPLAKLADTCITFAGEEQMKFSMVVDRLLWHEGKFADYDRFYGQMEQYLAEDLVAVEKQADAFGRAFAEKHVDDPLHYYVGAGALFGITYSYAMCYCEEMHWLRTKSIHSAEFFHGMLEIVERDTPVTVIIGEDSQRCLGQRVRNFLPRICGNYEIIDTKDYPMPGFDEAFRGRLQNAILHRVINRMDMIWSRSPAIPWRSAATTTGWTIDPAV